MKPLVSIVVPIYQVEQYIGHTIKSICEQTYKKFEIILVNDGTRDQSIKIAEKVLEKYKNIDYRIIEQSNSGVSAARNIGITNSRGEWVICVDSDDCLLDIFLERLIQAAEIFKERDPQIVVGEYVVTRSLEKIGFKHYVNGDIKYLEKKEIIEKYLRRDIKIISPAMLIRRDFLLLNQIKYDMNVRFSEDTLFIWKCLLKADGIVYNKEMNYIYLLHENSTMSSSDKNKVFNGFVAYKRFTEQLRTLDSELSELIMARWVLGALHSSAKMLKYSDYRELAHKMNYKEYVKKVTLLPDLQSKLVGTIARVNIAIMYCLCRIK